MNSVEISIMRRSTSFSKFSKKISSENFSAKISRSFEVLQAAAKTGSSRPPAAAL
jgi:hypothetical protein